jgi:hypothetical protein
MARSIFFLIFGVFIVNAACSQDKLSGRIYENKTKVYLAGITVEDLKSHVQTLSDSTGRFSIKTSIGDYVCFSGFAYRPDTLYIANLKYMEVLLDPKQNMLNEVKVTTQQTKTGNLSAAPLTGPLNSKTVLYQVDQNHDNNGGIKIKLFDSDNSKKKRQDRQIADNEEKQQAIYNVFQPKSLSIYLPIRGVEMDNFIVLYTPDVATDYSNGFSLVSYLNASYQKFLQIPADQRQSPTAFRLTLKSDTTGH